MSAAIAQVNGSRTSRKENDAMRMLGKRKARSARARIGVRALLALTAAIALLASIAGAAQAAAPALTLRTNFPDTATGGVRRVISVEEEDGTIVEKEIGQRMRENLYIENSGNATMSGPLSATVTLPVGLSAIFANPSGPGGGSCETVGQVLTCTLDGNSMLPNAQYQVFLILEIAPHASGQLVSTIEVAGGGVADSIQRQETLLIGPPKPFEVESFEAPVHDANGGDETQAGASPGSAANAIEVPSFANEDYERPFAVALVTAVSGHARNITVHTPAGMTANFGATPSRCTAAQLGAQLTENTSIPACPPNSQIGVAHVLGGQWVEPVYSMVPPPGVPAEFGFSVVFVPILIDAQLRPSDFGVDLVSKNTSSTLPLTKVEVELWGVPADPSHDTSRGECLVGETGHNGPPESCPTDALRKAFLRLPTSCNGPLAWSIDIDTYEEPNVYKHNEATTPGQVGCNQLEFEPSFEARPTTNVGDSPSGLEVKLHLPQNEDPDGLAEAQLRDLTMKMPEGLVVNSASADGLAACSPAQIGLESPVGQVPAHFNGAVPSCPAASKLGAVVVNTPAIDHPLPGFVYLASQGQNPYGSLLALYLVINDPQTGVVVKVPIQAKLDPNTGQLTTIVKQSPQQPFEDLSLELDKGAHAPLRTPIGCGNYTTQSHWTPWSSPEGKDVDLSNSFEITKGAGGGSCVSSEAAAPSNPAFEAGTLEPKAGAFSPFVLKLTRQDGSQQLTGIDTTLPKGLLASLAGTTYCPEAALAAAATKSGKAEQSNPGCPASSEVGVVQVATGAGPAPLHVGGKAYLTGPYKGAPLGLAVITPAVAGPFDLGTVVVRNQLQVDPETAAVRAVSDPIPHILQGVPLDIRQVAVRLERPSFTLNPTSCDPMAITGAAALLSGGSAALSSPFQVGGCANLPFKPKLALKLKGKTNRGAHPALRAVVTAGYSNEANVSHAVVALPHSEFLDQSHIGTVCTRVQYAAGNGGGEQCPKRSVYGYARAFTPLLDAPLEGPVYLRSSSHKLPDLVISLGGQIHVNLAGRVDSVNGGIRTTFETVPDAFVSKFVLSMRGGKKGLLQNSTDLCRASHKATVLFDAHNGKSIELSPELEADCGGRAKGRKRGR